ncbi:phosphotransferase family protein [Persicimonas caeni]|uniref:phosphotransferase family protein n=1 Tax=Persicimonas caeni TaxID=2292766 RepID=UPI00143DA3B5|nr:aminoglycoside phosphotransferase family protein [Persicimonas caeni]
MSLSESNRDLLPTARRLFGTLAGTLAGLGDAELRPLDRGLSADLFTVHPEPSAAPAAVVKLQRGFAGKVWAEAGALAFLADKEIPDVPRPLLAEPKHDPPALVLSWVGDAHAARVELDRLDEPALTEFAHAFGRWLAVLHHLEVPAGDVKMSSDPLALPDRLLTQAENALKRFERDFGEREPDLLDLLERGLRWLDAHAASLLPGDTPRRMIHRDLRAPNVLADADHRFCGVVDFEHAAAAHPAWDFAKLRWWWFDRLPALEAPFRQGYESKRAWPDRDVRRLFRIFEATTLVAYFWERHPVYPGQARLQLAAELDDEPRPRWR